MILRNLGLNFLGVSSWNFVWKSFEDGVDDDENKVLAREVDSSFLVKGAVFARLKILGLSSWMSQVALIATLVCSNQD
jgi:hypothetical protein